MRSCINIRGSCCLDFSSALFGLILIHPSKLKTQPLPGGFLDVSSVPSESSYTFLRYLSLSGFTVELPEGNACSLYISIYEV